MWERSSAFVGVQAAVAVEHPLVRIQVVVVVGDGGLAGVLVVGVRRGFVHGHEPGLLHVKHSLGIREIVQFATRKEWRAVDK